MPSRQPARLQREISMILPSFGFLPHSKVNPSPREQILQAKQKKVRFICKDTGLVLAFSSLEDKWPIFINLPCPS